MNFGASMAEITNIPGNITTVFWPWSTILYQVYHLWSERPESGCSMGQPIRSDLSPRVCAGFCQENGASEGETHAIKLSWKNAKTCKVGFVNQFIFHQIRGPKHYQLNVVNRKDDRKYFWSWIFFSKAFLGEIVEPQNGQFCIFLQFASDVFSTHGQNIIFPKNILWYLETSISM